jgi:hypothetical protein
MSFDVAAHQSCYSSLWSSWSSGSSGQFDTPDAGARASDPECHDVHSSHGQAQRNGFAHAAAYAAHYSQRTPFRADARHRGEIGERTGRGITRASVRPGHGTRRHPRHWIMPCTPLVRQSVAAASSASA